MWKQFLFTENHSFRQYNQKIADIFGEHLFSMTFVPSNIVVLTQRYPTEKLYLDSILLRDDIMNQMKDIVEYYKISNPIEV